MFAMHAWAAVFEHCEGKIVGWIGQVDTLHSGEYVGDAVNEAEERHNRRAMQLSFASNMCVRACACPILHCLLLGQVQCHEPFPGGPIPHPSKHCTAEDTEQAAFLHVLLSQYAGSCCLTWPLPRLPVALQSAAGGAGGHRGGQRLAVYHCDHP